ncbi:hypothetical protein FGO68_gene7703 [Halteria grandinella]|uniref:Uncharacterized protein n=1 Tax=Halteria grandinella TaxID=5974 RepID=A0A8J8NSZ2_HALGN|nr:hypothetical protein FGO68_gene7703 [Halteria grandinella]
MGISGVERRKFAQLQREHDSLGKSQGYAAEIEKYGEDIIGNLFSQNQTLKNVRTRTMQMLNTIGMSESILKLMERRSKTDMLIFIGLAILTLVLIYFLIAIVKPMLSGAGTTLSNNVVHTEE